MVFILEVKYIDILKRFTLFDCIDDDEFDGDIGEHDDEVPRAFVNFKVESQATIQPSQSITLTSFHVGDIEKNNYSNYNSILTENIASILPQTEEFVLRDNIPVHEEKQPEPGIIILLEEYPNVLKS